MENQLNSWPKYEALVLEDLKRLREGHAELAAEIIESRESLAQLLNEVKVELATLKGKAAVWGVFAGSIVAGIVSLLVKLFKF